MYSVHVEMKCSRRVLCSPVSLFLVWLVIRASMPPSDGRGYDGLVLPLPPVTILRMR